MIGLLSKMDAVIPPLSFQPPHYKTVMKAIGLSIAVLCLTGAAAGRPLSKTGKNNIGIASKTSKAEVNDMMSLSLSMSIPSIEYTEFGDLLVNSNPVAQSINGIAESHTPSISPTTAPAWVAVPYNSEIFDKSPTTSSVQSNMDDSTLSSSHVSDIEDILSSTIDACTVEDDTSFVTSNVELLYFYRLEAQSYDASSVHRIERSLLGIACNLTRDEAYSAILSSNPMVRRIAAVSKYPEDVVSSTCKFRLHVA